MSAGVSVAASGSALSFLLYENVNSRNNQAGYLIGDIVSEKKSLISDADFGEEKTETVIHVTDVTDVKPLYSCYSLADCKQVKSDASGKMSKSVVGWYSFRRNVTPVPTYRDRHLHVQLLELFGRDPEQFLFCLLTSSENMEKRTYSFRQHFLVFNPLTRKYDAVPLLIENLANINQHYREHLSPSSERVMRGLIEKSWSSVDGPKLVSRLQSKLSHELGVAVNDLLNCQKELEVKQKLLSDLQRERDLLVQRSNDSTSEKSRFVNEESNYGRKKERLAGRWKPDTGNDRGDYSKARYSRVEPSEYTRQYGFPMGRQVSYYHAIPSRSFPMTRNSPIHNPFGNSASKK